MKWFYKLVALEKTNYLSIHFVMLLYIFLIISCIHIKVSIGTGEISKQKCMEYSRAVYTQQQSPVLLPESKLNTVSECGIVEVPLIVGGVKAQIKEFPHMAVIGFGLSDNSEMTWHCGGALISESFILTAAHCINSREHGPAQKVRLGTIDMYSMNTLQEIPVSARIPHPGNTAPVKYNDIALLKLVHPVTFTPFVRPACLNTETNIPQTTAIATGFGKLSYESQQGSNELMKVPLKLIPNGQCNGSFSSPAEKLSLPHGVINSLICAGEPAGGKDTCQGDSGGPLQTVLTQPYCMYSIIGVTSFGKFCGFPNSPAIYTRVSEFVGWIESTIWN